MMNARDQNLAIPLWVPFAALAVGIGLLFVRPEVHGHASVILTLPLHLWPRAAGIIIIANVAFGALSHWSSCG